MYCLYGKGAAQPASGVGDQCRFAGGFGAHEGNDGAAGLQPFVLAAWAGHEATARFCCEEAGIGCQSPQGAVPGIGFQVAPHLASESQALG